MRIPVCVLIVSALAAPVLAQEPQRGADGVPPLHLADAIAWARAHHPAVTASAARVAAARQEPEMARTLMPPMVDFTIWQWPLSSFNPGDVNMYMFMLEQDLPGRGKRALRAAAAERGVERMQSEAGVRALGVETGVLQAYVALRASQRERSAIVASEPAAREIVQATEASYAAGRGNQATVVRASLAASEIAERLAMLDAEIEMRRIALNAAMGRPPETPIGALDDDRPAETVAPLPVLLDRARAAHPELLMAHAQIAEADAGVQVAQAEGKPDWVVQGGYMLMPGEVGAWTARVGITWPGAPWAKSRASIASAQASALAQAARADLTVSEQNVTRMVAEARASLVGVLDRLAIVRGTLRPQAVHVVEASRLAFAGGQVPLSEVLDAERMRLDTDVQIARLSGEADLAWAALETAVGATPSADGKE